MVQRVRNHTLCRVESWHGYLCLGIRPRPPEGAVAAHVCYLAVQRVGEGDCEGHALLSLVCGVPKHEALKGFISYQH